MSYVARGLYISSHATKTQLNFLRASKEETARIVEEARSCCGKRIRFSTPHSIVDLFTTMGLGSLSIDVHVATHNSPVKIVLIPT